MSRLVPRLPSGDYSGLRRILGLGLSLYELKLSDELVVIAVDFTGVRVHKAGGGLNANMGRRSGTSRFTWQWM